MEKAIYLMSNFSSGITDHSMTKINSLLEDGWKIKSITPQYVSATSSGNSYSSSKEFGGYLVILEKP